MTRHEDDDEIPPGLRAAFIAGRIVDDRRRGEDRRSDDTSEVTLGEVYRLCQKIDAKVEKQNGRVSALERDAVRMKTLWTAAVVALGIFGDYIRHKLGLP